ncbi:hypothetical protein LPJ61_005335 [Coemansia biformis]|uniref:Protein kinase domain-containing protein n=1 Tax=Coemansia biformis TaxID=1286918 RepID=A0A9W7Y906_9FUNG|nr:hypothetical protein LPJ61_005335 [Coemansia biformis]
MEAVAIKSASMPRNPYGLEDHQQKPIYGSSHKADGVFYYARPTPNMAAVHMVMEAKRAPAGLDINKDDLGQIADYAHAVWEDQPTRTFVPVLFAHGAMLDLLVFTRDKWYRAILGPLSYEVQKPCTFDIDRIRETMVQLWFVSTLPPNRFGHFCNVTKQPSELLLTHMDNSVMATAKVSVGDERSVYIEDRIKRVVCMRGRLAHPLEAQYKGKKAVLKLAWAPVDRLPEGAVYEFLDQKNVGGIPKVFDSGILCENVFGYRLEYLVLEHCGDPLDVCLFALNAELRCKGSLKDADIQSMIWKTVVKVIKQVSSCLVRARDACVLHRDISMGNIAVVDRKATIIDWGYAKIFDNSDGALTPVARLWGFNADEAMRVEAGHDGLTGTPLYMSIAILYGARRRSLMDDLEGVFYVVLHALAQLDTGRHECQGFTFIINKTLALVRSALLAREANFLGHFGVTEPGGHLGEVLHAMYRFLFWSRTSYIGNSLWAKEGYERELDLHLAKWFVDTEALEVLEQGDSDSAGDQGHVAGPLLPGDDATTIPEPSETPQGPSPTGTHHWLHNAKIPFQNLKTH